MSKKEQMFALVEQWRESGLTRKSFANRHGFESESFNYWCKNQYTEVVKCTDKNFAQTPSCIAWLFRTYFRFGHERPKPGGPDGARASGWNTHQNLLSHAWTERKPA